MDDTEKKSSVMISRVYLKKLHEQADSQKRSASAQLEWLIDMFDKLERESGEKDNA